MASEKLADRTIQAALQAAKSSARPRMLGDGRGLMLRVGPEARSARWVWRYRTGRKAHDLGLAPYPEFTLASARDVALELRRRRRGGVDPLAAKRAAASAGAAGWPPIGLATLSGRRARDRESVEVR